MTNRQGLRWSILGIWIPLLFSYASSTTIAAFDPSYICSLLVNGTKINDPRACNTWIECIDGQPAINGTCDDGDFYDRTKMECVPEEDTTCVSTNPCALFNNSITTSVVDPYSCSGYYYCHSGVASHGQCQSGLNYNPLTQSCIRNYPCETYLDPVSYCNIVPDGVFIENPAQCNAYQMCWQGEVLNGTCPGIFYYNPLTGYCDHPQNVACDVVVTLPPNAPDPDVCTKSGEFLSDGESCNGYYLCYLSATGEMELVHATCPPGRFFSSISGGECLPRTQTKCSYDRCVGLGLSGIQLCNLSNDGCHEFAVCQDGLAISTGQCPDSEYFDEITQRCTTQVISYAACVASGTDMLNTTETTPSSSSKETTVPTQATTTVADEDLL